MFGIFLAIVQFGTNSVVASAVWHAPQLPAEIVFIPLLAAWAGWAGLAISSRASDIRVAQQLSTLTSLPPLAAAAASEALELGRKEPWWRQRHVSCHEGAGFQIDAASELARPGRVQDAVRGQLAPFEKIALFRLPPPESGLSQPAGGLTRQKLSRSGYQGT